MTDHNREEREALIEQARAALAQYDSTRSTFRAERTNARDLAGVVRDMLTVFGQAHTPTSDERDDLIALLLRSREWNVADRADAILDAGFRRTVQGGPQEACAWCPAPARGTAIWQGHEQREPSCGEDGHGFRFEPAVQAEPTAAEGTGQPTNHEIRRQD